MFTVDNVYLLISAVLVLSCFPLLAVPNFLRCLSFRAFVFFNCYSVDWYYGLSVIRK
jgi:hypothetical protein